jgi:predicted RNA-binding Zn ribbon-like protein
VNKEQPKSHSLRKLLGGELCLDFLNTLDWRGRAEPEERLRTFQDFVRWSQYAGILTKKETQILYRRAEQTPQQAEKALLSARELREILYSIFYSAVDGKKPKQKTLDDFNAYFSRATTCTRIVWTQPGFSWQTADDKDPMDWMINPIIRSAAELLVSPDLVRVRACGDKECGWFFLDTSRNRSRRWCDMRDCGTRAKALRFYQKKKGISG